jgi:hypothetical protein
MGNQPSTTKLPFAITGRWDAMVDVSRKKNGIDFSTPF